jgi:hypothetical protein
MVRCPGRLTSHAGLNDLFTPLYLARAGADGLAEVELGVWDEAGHCPFFEGPSRFKPRARAVYPALPRPGSFGVMAAGSTGMPWVLAP